MATLSPEQQQIVRSKLARRVGERRDAIPLTKEQDQECINALDAFIDNNAAAINAAIPLPARSALSAAEKAERLAYVVLMRFSPTALTALISH